MRPVCRGVALLMFLALTVGVACGGDEPASTTAAPTTTAASPYTNASSSTGDDSDQSVPSGSSSSRDGQPDWGDGLTFRQCTDRGLTDYGEVTGRRWIGDFYADLYVCLAPASQSHIILRVVSVTEDWVPFDTLLGWTEAVTQRESETLRYYEAAIWEQTGTVHLYAFPNDFDPWSVWEAPPEDKIAYREQHALRVHRGLPEKGHDDRSAYLREAFEDFAGILVERHPEAEHHLLYSGHGAPGGYLFERQLRPDDADAFLAMWTGLLGRPLGVIDMSGPCNKGSYDDLLKFCKHSRYYLASDLPNGGYSFDEWTIEKYSETDSESQYHRLFASFDTLEEALIARVDLRRKSYEYARENLTQKRWAQATYLYSCSAFRDFSAAFEAFVEERAIQWGPYDLYELLLANSAPGPVLEQFRKTLTYSADNRDFFEWGVSSNGMISPLNPTN